MDNSVKPAIEKIKLQEQDNEVRLREKLELNTAILTLNRAIYDTSMNIEKLSKEYQVLIDMTDKLQYQLIVETVRKTAYTDQVAECRRELDELQKASVTGVSSVWIKRSELLDTVHSTTDKCDIWALLTKPKFDIKPNVIHTHNDKQIELNDVKLKDAIARKNKAIALRDFLLTEPDVGEEFIRTRNALQYSLDIMAQEKNT